MDFIVALIKAILSFFQKPSIPHPEEPVNFNATTTNTNIRHIISAWHEAWKMALECRPFWYIFPVTLVDNLHAPIAYAGSTVVMGKVAAANYGDRLEVDPQYANPGVLAHEMAHISYALLTELKEVEFANRFNELRQTDRLLKYTYSVKPYMRTNMVEAHADCYRYLGQFMPEELKQFYPELM